jgi:hypothetical protein
MIIFFNKHNNASPTTHESNPLPTHTLSNRLITKGTTTTTTTTTTDDNNDMNVAVLDGVLASLTLQSKLPNTKGDTSIDSIDSADSVHSQ